MNVRQIIELLSTFDPDANVVVEYDGQYQNVRAVQRQTMLTAGASWGDYQGIEALETRMWYPASEEELQSNAASPKEICIAIWGTVPRAGLGLGEEA